MCVDSPRCTSLCGGLLGVLVSVEGVTLVKMPKCVMSGVFL